MLFFFSFLRLHADPSYRFQNPLVSSFLLRPFVYGRYFWPSTAFSSFYEEADLSCRSRQDSYPHRVKSPPSVSTWSTTDATFSNAGVLRQISSRTFETNACWNARATSRERILVAQFPQIACFSAKRRIVLTIIIVTQLCVCELAMNLYEDKRKNCNKKKLFVEFS